MTKARARILYFDIETAPNLAAVWGHWEQNVISYDEGHEWYMLCFSWKWEGEKTIHNISQLADPVAFRTDPCNDNVVVRKLWELFDEADIVIAHNGDKFDVPKAQARFAILGLGPTSDFKAIDTVRLARRHFKFNSNSLDWLGQTLGLGRKVKHEGYEMWQGCMRGDEKWWKKMVRYNNQDIVLLEKVYKHLRAWGSNPVNVAHIAGNPDGCPTCGHNGLIRRGFHKTNTMTYQKWQCVGCGSYSRTRIAERNTSKPNRVGITRR